MVGRFNLLRGEKMSEDLYMEFCNKLAKVEADAGSASEKRIFYEAIAQAQHSAKLEAYDKFKEAGRLKELAEWMKKWDKKERGEKC